MTTLEIRFDRDQQERIDGDLTRVGECGRTIARTVWIDAVVEFVLRVCFGYVY